MSPGGGADDKPDLTFEMMRVAVAAYGGGVDPLDMTWVRLLTLMRTIPYVKLLQSGKKLTSQQHIMLQRMQDEG